MTHRANLQVLAVIPARGGSKGIPRKNLRPLAGKPLIFYSIRACQLAKGVTDVLVTTDDEEIALISQRFGAKIMLRPESLATDHITIDPVIIHAVNQLALDGKQYDYILTVQPTSPLIKAADIDAAIDTIKSDTTIDTLISAQEDRHLRWTNKENKFIPEYEKRVNRQQLPPSFKETGAILLCKTANLLSGSRVFGNIHLHITCPTISVDIDSQLDYMICNFILTRKRIVFSTIGNKTTGTGHVNRALLLANELVEYDIAFVISQTEDLAINQVRSKNYPTYICQPGQELETILSLDPQLIVNDVLDTSDTYITALKAKGLKVVNFEDLGQGSRIADATINALYEQSVSLPNIYSGPDYFCLRDEFIYTTPKNSKGTFESILVTFGGVDEGNLSAQTATSIEEIQAKLGKCIMTTIVTGIGYENEEQLRLLVSSFRYPERYKVITSTTRISDYMLAADLAITSAGRTVFELASLNVPMIVISQNEREETHTYAKNQSGIIHLGKRQNLEPMTLFNTLVNLAEHPEKLMSMSKSLSNLELKNGKRRVVSLIKNIVEGAQECKPNLE